jgi:hypothetical protein
MTASGVQTMTTTTGTSGSTTQIVAICVQIAVVQKITRKRCEGSEPGYPMIRTGLPQSVPRLQARRRARFAGSFVCSGRLLHGVGVSTASQLRTYRAPAA